MFARTPCAVSVCNHILQSLALKRRHPGAAEELSREAVAIEEKPLGANHRQGLAGKSGRGIGRSTVRRQNGK